MLVRFCKFGGEFTILFWLGGCVSFPASQLGATLPRARSSSSSEATCFPPPLPPVDAAALAAGELQPVGPVPLSRLVEEVAGRELGLAISATAAVASPPPKSQRLELAVHSQNSPENQLMQPAKPGEDAKQRAVAAGAVGSSTALAHLTFQTTSSVPRPAWHPPWRLHRVVSGHQGWVQCVEVDKSNQWFATGSNDRLIKIWDLASCQLKLSLTGHINTVRDIKISERHPYLFSCGEDNRVKCWDLEHNKVVRDYHGHLSGVYCLALHPSLDVLASGGRDAVVRVWDMRTKLPIHVLTGHSGTVTSLVSQNLEPQFISGSQDKMVRLWDLAAGKCAVVLTNHKKSIRAMAIHPKEYTFCSTAADHIKVWRCPYGEFDRNISGHNAIVNACAIKTEPDGSSVLAAGTNNGQLHFWDWRSGAKYSTLQSKVQPGSLESENGIFACTFDKSESRLITGECDKTIKVWREDENATPETHPVKWTAPRTIQRY
eukprot:GHVT01069944.1.p1 GENE.GHVT01069944.1~~GHVT01069944.1.p1  ORF type:complete len:488 (-),score=76.57 GHVT01069944.1:1099-2562(-)